MERVLAVVSDIKNLSELLAGARIEEAVLACVGGRMQLTLEVTRAVVEQQRVVRQGFRHRLDTPWAKSRVVINGIRTVTQRPAPVEGSAADLSLLSCDAVAGGYHLTIQDPAGWQFVLEVEQLTGSCTDVGEVIHAP